MSKESLSPSPPTGEFGSDIRSLASAIERRPEVAVEEAPKTISHRKLYWFMAALCAVAIGVVEVGILARSDAPEAPPPPAAVVAVLENDACAQRLAATLAAVDAYRATRGDLPPSLEALSPSFLAVQPVDPVGKLPLAYERDGEGVAISCPSGATGG